MQPTSATLYNLFIQERRYTVPHFQRPYVWRREEQWEPLWQDVKRVADEYLQATDKEAKGEQPSPPPPHFLGAIVISPQPQYFNHVPALDIIDGQQRLTTLQLLLAAVRDALAEKGFAERAAELQTLLQHNASDAHPVEKHKVWPTNADRSVYEHVVTSRSRQEVDRLFPLYRIKRTKRYERVRIADAYIYFSMQAAAYLELDGQDESRMRQRASTLVSALKNGVQLVVIELTAQDDPQVIFESLNGHGVPLLPSDLIRNFVFHEVDRTHGANAQPLYDNYWAPFESPFWKDEQKQGRLKRPRVDLFFFHLLTMHQEEDFRVTHLFQEFKTWWEQIKKAKKGTWDPEIELSSIRYFGDLFESFLTGVESKEDPAFGKRTRQFMRRLRVLDVSTAYPLLLALFGLRSDVSLEEREQALTWLESFLVRRMICGLDTKNYNRLFLQLIPRIKSAASPAQELKEALLEGSGGSVRWPSDDDFERAFLYAPAYERMRPARAKMVLLALEDHHITTHQEKVTISEANLTVEHVLPQQGSPTDYPLPSDTDEARERRQTLLHSFGNLTLLTAPLNSHIKNGPFSAKRPAIAAQSRLWLNIYFQQYADSDPWAEDQILKRGRSLLADALEIWPLPSK